MYLGECLNHFLRINSDLKEYQLGLANAFLMMGLIPAMILAYSLVPNFPGRENRGSVKNSLEGSLISD
jgi:hypothetical protein